MLLGIVLLALLFGEFTGRIQRLAEKEKQEYQIISIKKENLNEPFFDLIGHLIKN